MPTSEHTNFTRRQRDQKEKEDDVAAKNEDIVNVEDPCEYAARLNEIEHLRALVHQKNLYITQLSS